MELPISWITTSIKSEVVPPAKAVVVLVIGGISVIMDHLQKIVMKGVHEPFEEFKR